MRARFLWIYWRDVDFSFSSNQIELFTDSQSYVVHSPHLSPETTVHKKMDVSLVTAALSFDAPHVEPTSRKVQVCSDAHF